MSKPAIIIILLLGFIVYLVIDFGIRSKGNLEAFMDRWVVKLLWLWLPIYGIWRLSKEVFKKKK